MADNPHKAARRIAQERAWERWQAENPDDGWRPQRVGGDGEISPAELELHRRRNAALKTLKRDRGTMAPRQAAVDLMRANRLIERA